MSASSEADRAAQYVGGFHSHHSDRTWNAGHSQIDPWLRNVLIALQSALIQIVESHEAIAAQVDRQEHAIRQLQNHVRRQG